HMAARIRRVDADRMRDAVFVEKGFERHRRHGRVVLEDGVQADDDRILALEQSMQPLGLRHPMADTARAQHLERMQHHHLAAQSGKAEWPIGVEPLLNLPFGRRLVLAHCCPLTELPGCAACPRLPRPQRGSARAAAKFMDISWSTDQAPAAGCRAMIAMPTSAALAAAMSERVSATPSMKYSQVRATLMYMPP